MTGESLNSVCRHVGTHPANEETETRCPLKEDTIYLLCPSVLPSCCCNRCDAKGCRRFWPIYLPVWSTACRCYSPPYFLESMEFSSHLRQETQYSQLKTCLDMPNVLIWLKILNKDFKKTDIAVVYIKKHTEASVTNLKWPHITLK